MQLQRSEVAVVTGAASGIGAALARDLHSRGLRLALCDIDGPGLERLVAELGGEVHHAIVDVADEADVRRFADDVLERWGAPSVVIANAGVAYAGNVAESTTASYARVFDINLWGVIHTVRAFLPAQIEAGRGHVVTISSLFGLIGVPDQSAYCASKAAVRGFTESLDQELFGTGVGTTCVHPGAIATNIAKAAHHGPTATGVKPRGLQAVIAKGLRPAVAAALILGAVEADRKRVVIGRDARLFDVLQRLFPVGYRSVLRYAQRRKKR